MRIYHMFLPGVWAFDTDLYAAESLETEGFVHCSYGEQIDAVLDRYFSDAERVVIIEIETDKLSSPFKEEPSTNNEIYPHIYGPVNKDAIVSVASIDGPGKKEKKEA